MEADETLIAAELVPGGSWGVGDAGRLGATLRWPAHLPLRLKFHLLPVGFRERELNNPALWRMFKGRKGKSSTGAMTVVSSLGSIVGLN